jgi:site-specific DNA recombinase
MLDDICHGRITGLLFSKLARLARNTRELLEFAEVFRELGADLISLQESIDTSTPGGRLFYTVFAAVAQWEREEIAERIKAAVPIRAKLGKPINGKATLGYHWVEKKLVPNPAMAPIRTFIYRLLIAHRRLRTVARLLNDGGYRTSNGARFNFRTVRRLIQDPTPAGLHRANFTTLEGGKTTKLKPETEWVITPVEPIISMAIWEKCQEILNVRQRGRRPGRKSAHLFGGMVVCMCGHKMYVRSNNPKFVCQRCHNKVPIIALEALFVANAGGILLDHLKQAALMGFTMPFKESEQLHDLVKEQLRQVHHQSAMLEKLRLGGHISSDGFADRHRGLAQRAKELTMEIGRLEVLGTIRGHASSTVSAADKTEAYKSWPELIADEKRQVVEDIMDSVLVTKQHVTFRFTPTPTSLLPVCVEKKVGKLLCRQTT